MKTFRYAFAAVAFSSFATMAHAEIAVRGAYAPTNGYDDNDSVMVIVDGVLPNRCYVQGKTKVLIDKNRRMLTVRQEAERLKDGDCAVADADLPDAMKRSSSFMAEGLAGRLPNGEYSVRYQTPAGETTRLLNVDRATTTSTDSLSYAHMSNSFAPAKVSGSSRTFEIRLSGYLTSSCARVERVEVSVEKDVIVVLPILAREDAYCLPAEIPFYKIVHVKTPAPGRYLLHARSVGGGARNSFFDVTND